MATRNINDKSFWTDANLDSIAVPASANDFAPGPGETGQEDGVIGKGVVKSQGGDARESKEGDSSDVSGDLEETGDESADEVEPAQDDDEVDEGDVDDEGVDDDAEDDDDDLTDEELAKADKKVLKRYDDVRAYANRVQAELDALRAEQERATQPQQQQAPQQADPRYVAALAQQNPTEAFNYALGLGDAGAALNVIGQVQYDATDLAAQAQLARSEGDEDTAMQLAAAARNATSLAEQMRAAHSTYGQQVAMAPTVQRDYQEASKVAATQVLNSPENKRYIAYAARAGQLVRDEGLDASSVASWDKALKLAIAEDLPNVLKREGKRVRDAQRRKIRQGRAAAGSTAGGRGVARERVSEHDAMQVQALERPSQRGVKELWNLGSKQAQ